MLSAKMFGLEVVGYSGGEELVICPFHSDTNASSWFSPQKGLFYCSVCGFGLNASQLAIRMGLDLSDLEGFSQTEENIEDYDLTTTYEIFDLGESTYVDYFYKRGVSEGYIKSYGVQWLSSEPKAAVLPMTSLKGEVVGVSYRYIDPSKTGTRYKKLGNQTPLWPMHLLNGITDKHIVIVTEGAWSAMKMATSIVSSTIIPVAIMGAKANVALKDILAPLNFFVLYDNDLAGRNACRKLRKLMPGHEERIHTVSVSPDDMSYSEIQRLVMKLGVYA